MRSFLWIALAGLTLPRLASGDGKESARRDWDNPRYDCATLLAQLRADIQKEASRPLPLTTQAQNVRGDFAGEPGSPCDSFAQVKRALHGRGGGAIERGLLDGHRAAIRSDGPHGSGHYWSLAVAVEVEGRALGVCLSTKTAGWRNIPPPARKTFGTWHTLDGDRFHLWAELVAGGAESQSLIEPMIFRIEDHALVLDHETTRAEIGRFAKKYSAMSTLPEDQAAGMHRAAAAAYHAFATGTSCPKQK